MVGHLLLEKAISVAEYAISSLEKTISVAEQTISSCKKRFASLQCLILFKPTLIRMKNRASKRALLIRFDRDIQPVVDRAEACGYRQSPRIAAISGDENSSPEDAV